MKKILGPAYSLKLKNVILFLNWGLIFFQLVMFATLFRHCTAMWKSTLKMNMLFRRCLMLINLTLKYTTLLKVVHFNVELHNVVSTLTWHCAMSRRHINLKKNVEPTLKCLLGLLHYQVTINSAVNKSSTCN